MKTDALFLACDSVKREISFNFFAVSFNIILHNCKINAEKSQVNSGTEEKYGAISGRSDNFFKNFNISLEIFPKYGIIHISN